MRTMMPPDSDAAAFTGRWATVPLSCEGETFRRTVRLSKRAALDEKRDAMRRWHRSFESEIVQSLSRGLLHVLAEQAVKGQALVEH